MNFCTFGEYEKKISSQDKTIKLLLNYLKSKKKTQ